MHTKKENTCGIEGGTTLTSFKNTENMKTDSSTMEGAAVPPNFSEPDDGRVC
jgi:hypothetical protein